jgi:hypothetical protein
MKRLIVYLNASEYGTPFFAQSGLNHLAPDHSFLGNSSTAPANSPNMKGEIMKSRKTKQCIAELRAILKRGDLEPEQEKAVEFAIQRLKELNRLRKVDSRAVYECVAEISEKLVNAFCKSKVRL